MADHDPKMRQAVVLVDDDGNKETLSVAIAASDIEIGGVEIKNGTDDTRAVVVAAAPGASDAGLVVRPIAPVLGAGAVTALTPRMTLASDDPAAAALGAISGAAVISDANGTVQQLLRGLVATHKGSATARLLSAANTTNSTLVKNGAGVIQRVTGYNAATDLRYLKFYNKVTAPTVGTDTPVLTIALPALTAFDIDIGLYLATGIGYGITTAAADNSVAAPTAGDVTCLNVIYS